MRRRYGLEPEQLLKMYEDQDHKCYICSKESGDTQYTQLFVDHNHTTGKVRKLLCHRCNMIIGIIESQRHRDAIQYLEEHRD